MKKIEFTKENTLSLKGIAIIMMIFHHCFWKTKLFENYNVSFFPLNKTIGVEISLFFKICVSIFVFITGYGLTVSLKKLNEKYNWSNKEIFQWIINRLIKLLSGFWIIAILSYVICQILDERTINVFFKNGIAYGIIQLLINFIGLSNILGTETFNSAWWYMSIAILYAFSVPIFIKLFKKYNYFLVLSVVIFIPRVLGWKYVNSSYISFLFPLLLGIIFADNNLMVRIANFKIYKNIIIDKSLKFTIETIVVVLLFILYTNLPAEKFWEIRYGIIPVCIICYLYEFFIDLPVIKQILIFLGKHSMNIFLIHEFIRTYYLTDFVYSFRNFAKIGTVVLGISIGISILLEILKKIIRYDKLINELINKIIKKKREFYERNKCKNI